MRWRRDTIWQKNKWIALHVTPFKKNLLRCCYAMPRFLCSYTDVKEQKYLKPSESAELKNYSLLLKSWLGIYYSFQMFSSSLFDPVKTTQSGRKICDTLLFHSEKIRIRNTAWKFAMPFSKSKQKRRRNGIQQIYCRAEGIISFLENMICLFYKLKYTAALPFKKSSLSPLTLF